jgi:NADH-quinone oxidoreductase subunit D
MAETFLDSTELVLNMGPQHPSTHGVLRVIVKLDGEKVLGTDCVIGYLHRGVEKLGENRTYQQFAPYVDRMDYVASVSNGLGYCLAVEKLLGVEAPPRAQVVRVILTELNRIASHLIWLGTHALDIGAITPLFYCMRERELALNIFEKYCGARLTTHAFRIGGLQYETYDGFEKEVLDFCDVFLPKADEYEELLTGNRIWVDRMRNVGLLNATDCKAFGVILKSRRATAATTSTATSCAWKRCGSRCGSCARQWPRSRPDRSWPRCRRSSSRLWAKFTFPSRRPKANSATTS